MEEASSELLAERAARLHAEQERDFYRRIVEQAPVPLNVHVGDDLRFSVVHPTTQSFFGNRNLAGVDPRELDGGAGHATVVETAHRVLQTGVTQRLEGLEREVELPHGQKVKRRFNMILRRFEDSERKPLGVIIQFAEESDTPTARRWLEGVLDALPIGVALADPASGLLLYANKQAAEIAAQQPNILSPPSSGRELPTGAGTSEFTAMLADGEHHFRGTLQTLPGHDSAPSVMMYTTEDITREKAALAALESAHEVERKKSEFLAHFAHEIRNPLSTIIGYAELALGEDLSAVEDREFWQRVHNAGRQTLTLANDYLDAQVLAAGRLVLRPSPFSPRHLVEDVIAGVMLTARTKGLELRTGPGLAVLPAAIETDATRVRQILLNLMTNAIKFTDTGSVTIDVEVRSVGTRDELVFSVEDTGIGMDAEMRSRLFAAFERAGGQSGHRPGTGLGLHLSKRLAQLLGGDLILTRSEIGRGSRFELSLQAPLLSEKSHLPQN